MHSTEILEAIDKIAATSSKNDKEALVKRFVGEPEFCKVLEYAYNPFKTYGLRQIPERRITEFGSSDFDSEFDSDTWTLLDELASRQLTGNAARDAVSEELQRLNEASADLLVRIIRKDLRAGFSESTINKAKKGLIPDFPYMRCSLPKNTDLTKWPWEEGVIAQEKADGMFANIDYEEGGLVSIRSRQGTEFPVEKFPQIVEDVKKHLEPGNQHHGEFLVMRDGKVLPREIGNGIMNSIVNGGDFDEGDTPIYMIWDQIPLEYIVTKGKYDFPYKKRIAGLIQQLRHTSNSTVMLIPTKVVRTQADAYSYAATLMKKGKEGAIIKHPEAIWKDGTSKEQIKIKLEFDVDLEVVAIVPGNVGTRNEGRAGSLTCRSSCGLLQVDVTVKNEAIRDDVQNWIGKIIAVVANDITKPSDSNPLHSLFLPRMTEAAYRKDKTVADSLTRILDAKEAAIFGESLLKEAA